MDARFRTLAELAMTEDRLLGALSVAHGHECGKRVAAALAACLDEYGGEVAAFMGDMDLAAEAARSAAKSPDVRGPRDEDQGGKA